MIGTCIVMAIWTTGLLYLTSRAEKKRLLEGTGQTAADEKNYEVDMAGDVKV